MPNIDTLVKDIYGLFRSDYSITPEDSERFGQKLSRHLTARLGEHRAEHATLRLSNVGSPCSRKLWFSVNDPSGAEPLPPQARIKFLFGDILEELLLFLAEQAGHKVTGQQDELDINGVKGHRDAVIDGVLVDCKSASSISFDKFESGNLAENDPFGYIDQLNSYQFGSRDDPLVTEKDYGAFLVIDKTLGKICLDKHPVNGVDYEQVVEQKRELLSQPTPPERPYTSVPDGKSGNEKLPTICSYCEHKHKCWADKGIRTFLYANGPKYLVEVQREPNVTEIDRNGKFIERVE